MPIWILNPPAPHSDPVVGAAGERAGQRCGNCVCVPRAWLLHCDPIAAPFDSQLGKMGGWFLLKRDLAAFKTDGQQNCEWKKSVTLSDSPTAQPGVWSLFYTVGADTSAGPGWFVWANVSQPGFLPAINTYGPNAITAQPPTRDWSPPNWNCLSKNTLQIADGGLGFPALITVRPYWGLIQKKATTPL